ncbi:MAG TPA: SPOR domain-containing protein [Solirubrobacteraceae bacterium]|nr:SPOR domain-containing protein [Solirubrobacteraceae bacterium]
MNDDWRLTINLRDDGLAHQLGELLRAEEIEHDLERSFHDRVVVSVSGSEVFCYTGTRGQAERAEELIRRLSADHGWPIDVQLSHWHPTAEQWEDPDAPEPSTPADVEDEREERVEQEREESAVQGYPEMEIRVQCRSRAEAAELAERLKAENIPTLHRHSYVLIGATDEDSAQALAARLRGEVAPGTIIGVERNRRAIYDHRVWSPFSVLGGLGG